MVKRFVIIGYPSGFQTFKKGSFILRDTESDQFGIFSIPVHVYITQGIAFHAHFVEFHSQTYIMVLISPVMRQMKGMASQHESEKQYKNEGHGSDLCTQRLYGRSSRGFFIEGLLRFSSEFLFICLDEFAGDTQMPGYFSY